jgi:Fur family transcriptional regulator, ferric uptake regulator
MTQHLIHSAKDLLTSVGLKKTKERDVIFRELENRKDHFNAEKLYVSLQRKKAGVSRPTIYRTLKLLETLHFIEKLDIKKNCFYYEPISQKKDHGHLICEQCGKIKDFSNDGLVTLKFEVCKDKDFKLDSISVQVFGLCRDCQRASKNKN